MLMLSTIVQAHNLTLHTDIVQQNFGFIRYDSVLMVDVGRPIRPVGWTFHCRRLNDTQKL